MLGSGRNCGPGGKKTGKMKDGRGTRRKGLYANLPSALGRSVPFRSLGVLWVAAGGVCAGVLSICRVTPAGRGAKVSVVLEQYDLGAGRDLAVITHINDKTELLAFVESDSLAQV